MKSRSFHNLYTALDKDPNMTKPGYVLQTLWRDHSSKHDIVYMSTGVFKAEFMLACVMDTLRQFEAFNFRVSLLIMDGTSTNLTMIKILLGIQGVFGHDSTQDDCHRILTHITNPFSGDKLFFMICPTHQI